LRRLQGLLVETLAQSRQAVRCGAIHGRPCDEAAQPLRRRKGGWPTCAKLAPSLATIPIPMAALTWTEALALQQPRMDDTHREFVELLGELEAAIDESAAELAVRLDRFVEHTETHFAQEDAWMATIGFAPENCHATQHAQVLQLLHEVRRRLRDDGQTALVGQLVPALAEWFVPHAQNMDGGLAQVMQLTGFDPATGLMSNPPDASSAPSDEAFAAPVNADATPAATAASGPTPS
jgi:hemerythrin-like metal-binding protein